MKLSICLPALVCAFVGLLLCRTPLVHAVVIGVTDSYEGYTFPTSGTQDYRGYTRYDRLVEVLEGWKTIGVDFGVLLGDNIANSEAGWPLLLQAIEDSGLKVYLVLGNHDWVNQVPGNGGAHPESCFNLKPQEQDPSCPNTIYFLDYLWSNYGYNRPWYSFEQDGVLFAFLADELYDSRGLNGGGISDIHDEQFYWFRDLVTANQDKPIVVFAHHPVYSTVRGSNSGTLNRLGWRPRVGEDAGDTVSVINGSSLVTRASQAFDPKRVTVGAEFQIQGETEWYEIASISGSELTLTQPYQGATDTSALFWAGGHFNELTQIMKDPGNSIEVIMSGHTDGDFQATLAGLSQMEIVNDKTFAFSGNLLPVDISLIPLGDFFVDSPTIQLTKTAHSYRILPGVSIRPPGGSDIEVIDVSWPDLYSFKSTVTLASSPDVSEDIFGAVISTKKTDPFTETRVLHVDGTGSDSIKVVNYNYATGWRSGALLEGSFEAPDFPSADLTGATLEIDASTARLTPTSAYGVALYGSHYQHFYSVEVDFERVSGGGGGIAFRAQDGNNFYYFELDESSQRFKLGKCENGSLTTLAEVYAVLTGGYTLKIRVQGSRIQAFVNNWPAIMFYDTSFPTGRYGIFSRSGGGSDFENLKVIGDIQPYNQVTETVPSITFGGLAFLAGLVLGIRSWVHRG